MLSLRSDVQVGFPKRCDQNLISDTDVCLTYLKETYDMILCVTEMITYVPLNKRAGNWPYNGVKVIIGGKVSTFA